MTTALRWQDGMGRGRSSSEDVYSLGHVMEKFVFTVMLSAFFLIKMPR